MPEEKKRIGAGIKVKMGRYCSDAGILIPDKADSAFRNAGEWCIPGGKLDWGESLEDAAIREVKEETGMTIENPEVISVHNTKNEHAHFVTVGMVARSWKGEAQVMEPDEMVEWRWFPLDDLPYPRYFPSFQVIENYLEGKFYIPRS